ncbi:Ion channel [Dictyocaulus viviparus]|uniref:Ion channel n=1 Tax=Dictyocaulus viviparus TaxID=29172 RepID=A0A0D8Y6I7_DICVI|nr:Ion channel [Dictyocaulus viviparus]
MKPYDTWKQEFIADRCCQENDFLKELLVASSPHVLLNLVLITYLLLGTVVLRYTDEAIGKEKFPPALLFSFTTITTIGYGSIYPKTDIGKLCCMLYCVVGIPLVFLVLSNNGQFIVDAYMIIRKSFGSKKTMSKGLPLWLSFTLLFLHSLVGGLIFSTWMGQMRFFEGVYCSFISVSTIGYGDLVPVPDNWTHTVAIIAFLSTGVVILSTLFETFGCYLQYLHYIGRRFTGTKDIEIWFGGRVLTVQELIALVADQFEVSPRRLRAILRDLDNILEAAYEDMSGITVLGDKSQTVLPSGEVSPDTDVESTQLYRTSSNSSMQRINVRDTENALHALRVIHHKLNKSPFCRPQRERQDLEVSNID